LCDCDYVMCNTACCSSEAWDTSWTWFNRGLHRQAVKTGERGGPRCASSVTRRYWRRSQH